ncbi:MAG: class I SAM-dependent methyltransferase [Nitrospirae bacterium]|nr:class I SAM-dependent methyltransferase [Nitrospirota bacterium]
MTNPPIKRKQLAPLLDEYSRAMPLIYRTKVANRHIIGAFHLVLDSISEGARLFDIGCGTGALLYLAIKLRHVELAHGYDLSREAIEASQSFKGELLQLKLMHRTEMLPPQDLSSYDVVTMVDVLHHVASPIQDAFISRLARCMSSGAVLILADIEGANLFSNATARLHDLVLNKQLVRPRTSAEVVDMLKLNGMQIASISWCWSVIFKSFVITAKKT